ncbi:hypothetical protein [Nocardia sp. NPDC050710]
MLDSAEALHKSGELEIEEDRDVLTDSARAIADFEAWQAARG